MAFFSIRIHVADIKPQRRHLRQLPLVYSGIRIHQVLGVPLEFVHHRNRDPGLFQADVRFQPGYFSGSSIVAFDGWVVVAYI